MCTLTHPHYKTFYLSEYLLDPLSFPLTLSPPSSPSLPERLLETRRLLVCVYIYYGRIFQKAVCRGERETSNSFLVLAPCHDPLLVVQGMHANCDDPKEA